MRAREFLMKGTYGFDKDEKSGELTYENFFRLYLRIFDKLGLKIIPLEHLVEKLEEISLMNFIYC